MSGRFQALDFVPEAVTDSSEVAEAYRVGKVQFMGVELLTAPGALVPRKETELLARTAVERIAALPTQPGQPLVIVDMCCGAGNLACSLAINLPSARLYACDLTDYCVALTKRNLQKHGLSSRAQAFQGDLFQALAEIPLRGAVDAIVCNPPYISQTRLHERRDLEAEPREAFDGGPYGLSIHQRVMREAEAYLKPGGCLLFEFGRGQGRQIELLFQRARIYDNVEMIQGDDGQPRVAAARRRLTSP